MLKASSSNTKMLLFKIKAALRKQDQKTYQSVFLHPQVLQNYISCRNTENRINQVLVTVCQLAELCVETTTSISN